LAIPIISRPVSHPKPKPNHFGAISAYVLVSTAPIFAHPGDAVGVRSSEGVYWALASVPVSDVCTKLTNAGVHGPD